MKVRYFGLAMLVLAAGQNPLRADSLAHVQQVSSTAIARPAAMAGNDSLLSGGPADASAGFVSRNAALDQTPDAGNAARIDQGPEGLLLNSFAAVSQDGSQNSATIIQTSGADLWASISQRGVGNMASITQSGTGNFASVIQSGAGNIATISQSGTGNVARVAQR